MSPSSRWEYPQTPPHLTLHPQLCSQLWWVIDILHHHCALWRDDHWVQQHNNGIADRESRSLTVVPGYYLNCTCGLHLPSYRLRTQLDAPGARVRASRAPPPPSPPGIVLCWVDRIAPCSRRIRGLNESSAHIWTTCAVSSVTLMGTSTSSRENACDEGIISAAEHVSGHYSNTIWWHS